MRKLNTIIASLLLSACSQNPFVLSISPQTKYEPTLSIAGSLSYLSPSASPDPYLSGNNVVKVSGLVGQFKTIINNDSDEYLSNVKLIVSVNDSTKVSDACLSRIYNLIYWGGSIFDLSNSVSIDLDDLPPHVLTEFDSIVLGNSGLKLHFQSTATFPNSDYALSNGNEMSVVFE